MHAQQFQRFHVHAAEFAAHRRLGRDRISHRAAGDGCDVERGFLVDATLGEFGDQVAGDLDGRQPFLRLHAGVGAPAAHVDVERHVGRAGAGDGVDRAVAVEYHRLRTANHGEVEVGRADQSDFLAASENHFQRATGAAIFLDGFQRFQDRRHAGLAVTAQDGAAVGRDAVSHHLGLDAAARVHRVHVRGQDQGAVAASVLAGNHVAMIIAGNLESQVAEALRDVQGNVPFFTGRTVDSHQVAEIVDQSFMVWHGTPRAGG